ncbi:transposase [uncultured Succinivibrio sp.]|uniref:transposase n=1 Tax=uncultured Succinivibrio sp. TaxID=540749 RepID=UPI0025FCEB19|nr:transposase [uncultured Succinivibrio sp.]
MDKEELFKPYIQDDLALLPPCIGDFISPSDPVRLVSTIVDKLDISNILKDYKGGGTTSYHPRMLLKVIIYAYLCNIYSGRKIEPDYRTINLFRSKRLANGIFEDLFSQVVELLNSEGLVSLQVQYIDGTKIESAANKYTFVWRGSVEKNKQKLLNKVHFILVQANDLLSQELQEEIPDELSPELMKEKTERIIKKLESSDLDKDNLKKKIKE